MKQQRVKIEGDEGGEPNVAGVFPFAWRVEPISDMTVVPSIIELKGRFPGLGKVWATTVHERLRYAKRKSFHEQVAYQIRGRGT
jgi:hypothetical protein